MSVTVNDVERVWHGLRKRHIFGEVQPTIGERLEAAWWAWKIPVMPP